MKVISLSCMHGRHQTVSECIKRMPFIDKYYIASTDEDIEFLKSQPITAYAQYQNYPISWKWNTAISLMRNVDFDAVILLGSDDYIDEKYLRYVEENISNYEMIAVSDMYFKQDDDLFYWPGYTNSRRGEPSGAGKTYSKKFLERINFNLFPLPINKGLDGMSWKIVTQRKAKVHITSLKENGLLLVDIKDGEGLTSLDKFNNLEYANTNTKTTRDQG